MNAQAERVIDIKGMSKVFYTEDLETHALSTINLSINKGDFVAIVGPSGSGKTTLLAILGLLDSPTTGSYELGGTPVEKMSAGDLALMRSVHIGFIFQTFNLIGDLTIEDNVELPLVYRRVPRDERKKRVQSALERVGVAHRARHMPGQLSGGQQQRVAVARSLVGNPSILLADEPTGNLDSTNGETVMDLITELHASGSTVCMVTHDAKFALRAQRRVRLTDGRLVAEAS
jgi:putative ABC transport system ATP-binding protein